VTVLPGVDRNLAAALVIGVTGMAGCDAAPGGDDGRASDDRAVVLRVMESARSAVLAGDAETACGLLTPHARERLLGFQVDFLPTGAPVPSDRPGVPQTCEEMMGALRQEDPWSVRDLRAAEFEVRAYAGDQARVRLKVPEDYGPTVKFWLIRTRQGWRIDDSDAVPSGY
jgi:hypothetical protein